MHPYIFLNDSAKTIFLTTAFPLHCTKCNPNFREMYEMYRGRRDTTVHEIFRVVFSFFRYISFYIAENRLALDSVRVGCLAVNSISLSCCNRNRKPLSLSLFSLGMIGEILPSFKNIFL